jgi:hypothetical protein
VHPASAIIAMAPENISSWRIYVSPGIWRRTLHWHIDEGQAADRRPRACCVRNLTCTRIQVDEIWEFVYAKQKSLPTTNRSA